MRNPTTTRAHVAAGNVYGLFNHNDLIATFTITAEPPHGVHAQRFPEAGCPVYLQRLAVQPAWVDRDALIGVRCVRKACELAKARGADALRAEVNPDLKAVRALLEGLGFRQHGPAVEKEGRRAVYLQYEIS
ncbi:hypothetical protein CDG76_35150 [Nostoc sp. 'Peltigera membranacea cyanobiont' 210A]|nr:hypothetical protein CDG76_35150 [Nostoc sp. 'Peltigera membranacea cyanobiont' 210A]